MLALGLFGQGFPVLPTMVDEHLRGALWALLVYLGWGLLFASASPWRLALCTLAVSFAVEFTQLHHAFWIDRLRGSTLGRLVLGSTFSWIDFMDYAIGAGIGVAGDYLGRAVEASRSNRSANRIGESDEQ